MKDHMKIDNRGKFHQYSIFGCQVKMFHTVKSFAYQFSIHVGQFRVCFAHFFAKYGLILLKFSLELVL